MQAELKRAAGRAVGEKPKRDEFWRSPLSGLLDRSNTQERGTSTMPARLMRTRPLTIRPKVVAVIGSTCRHPQRLSQQLSSTQRTIRSPNSQIVEVWESRPLSHRCFSSPRLSPVSDHSKMQKTSNIGYKRCLGQRKPVCML